MTPHAVMERLLARVEREPGLLDTLEYLAESTDNDPFATPPAAVRQLAREVNRRRQADRAEQLRQRSLTTAEVVELVPSISDRKGVDRRRRRGTLLGISGIDREIVHPRWQFDQRRRDTYPGLPQVLAALSAVAADPMDADAIATAGRHESHGRSIADLLAAGDVDAAIKLAHLSGDQS